MADLATTTAEPPFRGWIVSTGSSSGTRVVVGSWDTSPFGRVDDVMVEHPDGRRVLYAPTAELAAEIRSRYRFDEVVLGDVRVLRGRPWRVRAPGLEIDLAPGRRTALGALLRLVPGALRERLWWARVCDPLARRVVPGVRTAVATRPGWLWYAASDQIRLEGVTGAVDGEPLGVVAPLQPPVRFGGSSAPPTPCLTRVSSHRVR